MQRTVTQRRDLSRATEVPRLSQPQPRQQCRESIGIRAKVQRTRAACVELGVTLLRVRRMRHLVVAPQMREQLQSWRVNREIDAHAKQVVHACAQCGQKSFSIEGSARRAFAAMKRKRRVHVQAPLLFARRRGGGGCCVGEQRLQAAWLGFAGRDQCEIYALRAVAVERQRVAPSLGRGRVATSK